MMNVPFPVDIDRVRFLKTRSYYETRDEEHIHFVRILDKKLVGFFSYIFRGGNN